MKTPAVNDLETRAEEVRKELQKKCSAQEMLQAKNQLTQMASTMRGIKNWMETVAP